jgi:hypothetical protein
MKIKLCLFCLGMASRGFGQIEVVSDGKVGIGTTAPTAKLEVNGTAAFSGWIGGTGAAGTGLSIFGSKGDAWGKELTVKDGAVGIGTSSPAGRLHLHVGTNRDVVTYAPASATGISDFATGGVGWVFTRPEDGSLTEAIYTYDSNSAKNNLALSSRSDIVFTAGNSGPAAAPERMRIADNGNVGIGTANPGYRLDVRASGDAQMAVMETSSGNYARLVLGASADETYVQGLYSVTAKPLTFKINGEMMRIATNGNVGIGTASPAYKLDVAGQVHATSFVSSTQTYADFVFKPGYDLPALSDVEAHIKEHGHLPGVPSEAQVAREGIDLAAMQVKLLQKVEELTLYVIKLNQTEAELRREIQQLKSHHP